MGVVLMILGFVWWWPIGLLVLGFLIARRKYGYRRHLMYAGDGQMFDLRQGKDRWERKIARYQEKMDRIRGRMDMRAGEWFGPSSSGNRAFDEYRSETLKRLEDEQVEFKDFLGRLRFAKDRAEFDQFMNDRRQRPADPAPPSEPPRA